MPIYKQATFFLKVPTDWDFISVLDLFIKIHLVFNIQYHQSLKQFMIFFENFAFNITDKTQSPTAHETYIQFKALLVPNSDVNANR